MSCSQVWPISTSCDLDLWPTDPKVDRFIILALLTTCATLQQNECIRFQIIEFTKVVTNKRSDRSIMPPISLDKRMYKIQWKRYKIHKCTECLQDSKATCIRGLTLNKNIALRIEAGPPPSTLASSTQRTTIVNNRLPTPHSVYNRWPTLVASRPSCLVYNSCGLKPRQTGGRINICIYCIWNPNISPGYWGRI